MSKRIRYVLTATAVQAMLIEKIDDQEENVLQTLNFEVGDVAGELQDGDNVKSLAAYGLSKILQDRTSSVKNEDKMAEMEEVFELLKTGQWRQRREGAGTKKATIDPVFAQAIAEIKGCDVATATLALQSKTSEERKAMRALDLVKDKINELRERANEQAGDLLDDLVQA